MSYKRDSKVFKTGVQEIEVFSDAIDMAYDFVMVYGFHNNAEERIKQFREQGYHVHFMTGIAWGHYEDYLYGKFDGKNHWDEAQMDKDGQYILHGVDVPYMVPTLNYANYMIEKLKKIIDQGVYHIHLEEPEFWQHGGYSKAFEREYEIYYQEPYNQTLDNHNQIFKVAQLKSHLYTRAIAHIAYAIKLYGKETYNQNVFVYIPTHSLLNYTQWHLVSPESKLAHLNEVDGFIGQIWAGTAKVQNRYLGVKKERTFETAFLEYGIVSGLNYGSKKTMWYLNDPIEDNPGLTWETYAYDYQRTLVASLLHPQVNQYEICPWPTRVFKRKLPRIDNNSPSLVEPKFIPASYDVLLNNTFQMLGDMPLSKPHYEGVDLKVGLCLSDSAMYQRKTPQNETCEVNLHKVSIEFPDYYGLALPLLKMGVPLMGVILDHAAHFESYLEDYDMIVLSYEFMKPLTPDIHYALKRFVESGKILLYVGDDSDPFHHVNAWWNQKQAQYTPRKHLFETLGVNHHMTGIYPVGQGLFGYFQTAPYKLTKEVIHKSLYTQFFMKLLKAQARSFEPKPYIRLKRGSYEIISVMDETCKPDHLTLEGYYLNMLSKTFELIKNPVIEPGEVAIYFDVKKAKHHEVMGSTYRILEHQQVFGQTMIKLQGKKEINGYVVLKANEVPKEVIFGDKIIDFGYHAESNVLHIPILLSNRLETLIIHD